MGDIKKSSNTNTIWCDNSNSLCKNVCFTEVNGYLDYKECNKDNINQYWMIESTISTKTQTAYIYNKHYKKCLYNKGTYGLIPVLADCSNNSQFKWIVPITGAGFYRSAYNTTSCLHVTTISKGSIWVMECDHRSLMQDYKKSYGGEAIWSTLSDTLCLGLLSSDNKSENRLSLNSCDTSIGDQHWNITTTLPSEGR